MDLEHEKAVAARASMRFVHDGQVVGLGTGSTAAYMLRFLGERVRAGLKIRGVPTSDQTADVARSLNIPLTTLQDTPQVDVTIDGADEVDPQLHLIKGGGGALFREKIVARASRKMVVIADSTKQVPLLGKFPLPVAVLAAQEETSAQAIRAMGASVQRREKTGKVFITDEGYHILDCCFGRIPDPAGLAQELKQIEGVMDTGLFINLADVALIARGNEVIELVRKDPKPA
jgi:ribose 5-phosphate isomerase A